MSDSGPNRTESNQEGKAEAICDADLEREIRNRRKFTAEEAIGRLAGPGAMKGGSPISPQQQAENAVGVWLGTTLMDQRARSGQY